MKIHGYGRPEELDLAPSKIEEGLGVEKGEFGKLIETYDLEHGTGGNVLNPGGLTGRMFEFEDCYIVAWSCGEYIDVGQFKKK